MKKLLLIVSAVIVLSANLTGCGFHRWGTPYAGYVATTTDVTVKAVRTLEGQPATARDIRRFERRGVVYHNGLAYRIHNGVYVLVR